MSVPKQQFMGPRAHKFKYRLFYTDYYRAILYGLLRAVEWDIVNVITYYSAPV